MPSISLADMTPEQVSNFCGVLNRNAKAIEQHFGLRLRFRDQHLDLVSSDEVPQEAIDTIEHILGHLGLPTKPPQPAPARAPPQCDLDFGDFEEPELDDVPVIYAD